MALQNYIRRINHFILTSAAAGICILATSCADGTDADNGQQVEANLDAKPSVVSNEPKTPDEASRIIYTHFVGGTPENLSAFEVASSVTSVNTTYWRSNNPDLNGKPKTHRLKGSWPINDDLTVKSLLMKNFYGYDAQAHLSQRLTDIRLQCEGQTLDNGLLMFTADAVNRSPNQCKDAFDITGRRPVYISQKATEHPFFIECRSSCDMKIIKWNRIGFDIPIPETKLSDWNEILTASFDHIDNILSPVQAGE